MPTATLAVLDLADRIHKRHRATDLIDRARHLSTQHVTVYLMTPAARPSSPPPTNSSS